MKPINPDDRLLTIANCVRRGCVAADIGTDHGYLAVYLVQNGIAKHVFACDINEGPLSNAQATIKKYGLGDHIETRLSNGLEKIAPNECSDIIIAGMGGELIASILSDAQWVKSKDINLCLQPMTKADALRKFLCENSFVITDETAVAVSGKIYTCMCVTYGNIKEYDELYYYIGELKNKYDEMSIEYKTRVYNSLKKQANGSKDAHLVALCEALKGYLTNDSK